MVGEGGAMASQSRAWKILAISYPEKNGLRPKSDDYLVGLLAGLPGMVALFTDAARDWACSWRWPAFCLAAICRAAAAATAIFPPFGFVISLAGRDWRARVYQSGRLLAPAQRAA